MKTLLYANRAEPKSISVISILLLAAVGAITKLRCMHGSVISLLRKIFDIYLQWVIYLDTSDIKRAVFLYICYKYHICILYIAYLLISGFFLLIP